MDVNGDGVCDFNCEIIENNRVVIDEDTINEEYKSCPTYQMLRITIPVVVEGQEENIIDDFEFFYIGQ